MAEDNGKIEHRITCLEVKVEALSDNIGDIKDNHLVHLKTSVEEMKTKQDANKNWLIAILVGVIVDLITRVIQVVS